MKLVIVFFSIFILGTGSIISLVYHPFSKCPIRFRFEFETSCWLRDDRFGYKLIELFNPDSNGLWLAKVKDNETIWLEHPDGIVKNYNSHIPENSILFKTDDMSIIIVNGTEFKPKILSEKSKPK